MATRIRVRRGTSTQWTSINPLLLSGEFGYETDTQQLKIGNGTAYWNTLGYLQGSGGGTGADGDSAYQVAVNNGFVGTEQEWLTSLQGTDGLDGDSAYEIAVANGFVGTEAEWLESLKPLTYIDGAIFQGDGDTPETMFTVKDYGISEIKLSEAAQQKLNSVGADGLSAYEIAVNNGFVGTEAEWITSLEGPQGPQGEPGQDAGGLAVNEGFSLKTTYPAIIPFDTRKVGTLADVTTIVSTSGGLKDAVGALNISTGNTATGYAQVGTRTSGEMSDYKVGQVTVYLNQRVGLTDLSTATESFQIRIGFERNNMNGDNDGVFFRYNHAVNAGNVECVTRSSSTETITDSGFVFTPHVFHIMEISVALNGTVTFSIDKTLVATHTTNVPPDFGYMSGIKKLAGTQIRRFHIDWTILEVTLATPLTL